MRRYRRFYAICFQRLAASQSHCHCHCRAKIEDISTIWLQLHTGAVDVYMWDVGGWMRDTTIVAICPLCHRVRCTVVEDNKLAIY